MNGRVEKKLVLRDVALFHDFVGIRVVRLSEPFARGAVEVEKRDLFFEFEAVSVVVSVNPDYWEFLRFKHGVLCLCGVRYAACVLEAVMREYRARTFCRREFFAQKHKLFGVRIASFWWHFSYAVEDA